ncbi:RNA polymerase sigma-70 factor, ECF subfamily [Chitinophaga costaii]|uniref:RNA polymerase sigma-70 factor, ECF subfamily n=1 Tax=Chitinophaga costaii TaxID=1335309 RepID=A0A1C4BHK7_9BACT|nr:RNA polymerase sigma-70 factor [Chitinophaga costaii]PUZ27608.1 RNA polymerase sigma-70 factor [Chitinophaga costaii]SCC06310.1 RNA polymerase sigma-70 factor, ECF subfamily [Chitinophaga costaii]
MLSLTAFETIFKTHHAHCLAFAAQYTGSRYEAEEVVQQVFLNIWEKRDNIEIAGPEKSYLFTAIRNVAISRWRKQSAQTLRETAFGQLQPVVADAVLPGKELEASLHKALDKLPERCREVFLLSRQQQLKYAEIAAVMGIAVKTVENQMGKALKILHNELREYLPAERHGQLPLRPESRDKPGQQN